MKDDVILPDLQSCVLCEDVRCKLRLRFPLPVVRLTLAQPQ